MTRFVNDLPPLDSTYLLNQFSYDPGAGTLVWNVSRKGVALGRIAGRARFPGDSIHISLGGKAYPVELLVWVMRRGGSWPSHVPYHRDGDRENNRIENLALPVGAQQIKPPRERLRQHNAMVRAIQNDPSSVREPRRAPSVLPTKPIVHTRAGTGDALTQARELLERTQEKLRTLLDNAPADMHPPEANVPARLRVLEYTRQVEALQAALPGMHRSVETMERTDAENPEQAMSAQPPIKGAEVLASLFAKALQRQGHTGT